MCGLRAEEKVAAATIERTLGLQVRQHHDGSQPGTHDLAILVPGDRPGAVEMAAAADPASLEALDADQRE